MAHTVTQERIDALMAVLSPVWTCKASIEETVIACLQADPLAQTVDTFFRAKTFPDLILSEYEAKRLLGISDPAGAAFIAQANKAKPVVDQITAGMEARATQKAQPRQDGPRVRVRV